jgi:hypothetical protein
MAFEQATIKVDKEREFGELKAALDQAFSTERAAKYLKALESRNVRVRNFDAVLAGNVLDSAVGAKTGTARGLYEALTVSDQAQIRELYLSRLEQVDSALRAKFYRVYQYS